MAPAKQKPMINFLRGMLPSEGNRNSCPSPLEVQHFPEKTVAGLVGYFGNVGKIGNLMSYNSPYPFKKGGLLVRTFHSWNKRVGFCTLHAFVTGAPNEGSKKGEIFYYITCTEKDLPPVIVARAEPVSVDQTYLWLLRLKNWNMAKIY